MPTIELRQDGRMLLLPDVQASHEHIVRAWVGWSRQRVGVRIEDFLPEQGSSNWHARAWPSAILAVQTDLPGFPVRWSEGASKLRDLTLRRLALGREAAGGGVLLPTLDAPTSRRPKRHQADAVEALKLFGYRAMLNDDMGLGKTATALWAFHESGAKRVLVLCPVSTKYNWQREIEETLGRPSMVIDGTRKKRADQLAQLSDITVMNYDLLQHLLPEQLDKLIEQAREFLILDESHYCKTKDSARTRLTKRIAEQSERVLALTGTPVRNLIDDLFSQVEMVRPGTWTSWNDFEDRHLVVQQVRYGQAARPVRKVVGTKNIDQLQRVLSTMQVARKKENVLDLPPKTITYPELQLDAVGLRLYSAMRSQAKIELQALMEGEAPPTSIWDPRAKSAIEAIMRLEQIAQGFCGGIPDAVMQKVSKDVFQHAKAIPGRDGEMVFLNAPKLMWVIDAVESICKQGGRPVVFSRFNAPMFWLAKDLNDMALPTAMLHGGLAAEERASIIERFQNGGIHVLLCQVRIAEGFNLTRSQDAIFLGRDWAPAANTQAEDRLHRMGQKGTVNIQVPLMRDTIEMRIDKRLRAKDVDVQQALNTMTIEELLEDI